MNSEANTGSAQLKPILSGGGKEGNLYFARASALKAGDAIQGTFEGTVLNDMTEKDDFKVRITESSTISVKAKDGSISSQTLAAGDLVIINGAGNLGYQMGQVSPGELVRIEYNGRSKITKGKMKGKEAHSFNVLK